MFHDHSTVLQYRLHWPQLTQKLFTKKHRGIERCFPDRTRLILQILNYFEMCGRKTVFTMRLRAPAQYLTQTKIIFLHFNGLAVAVQCAGVRVVV